MSECGQWSNSYWRVRHQRSTAAVDQLICVTTLQCPDLSNNAQSWTMIIITVSQPESIRASFKRYHCVIVITKINYYYIFFVIIIRFTQCITILTKKTPWSRGWGGWTLVRTRTCSTCPHSTEVWTVSRRSRSRRRPSSDRPGTWVFFIINIVLIIIQFSSLRWTWSTRLSVEYTWRTRTPWRWTENRFYEILDSWFPFYNFIYSIKIQLIQFKLLLQVPPNEVYTDYMIERVKLENSNTTPLSPPDNTPINLSSLAINVLKQRQ